DALDGSGRVVELTISPRLHAEDATLQPGERDLFGGSHDVVGGHVRLEAPLPTDRVMEDFRVRLLPAPLKKLLGLTGIPTPALERRTQVMFGKHEGLKADDVATKRMFEQREGSKVVHIEGPQAGDVVPKRMFEQFNADISRANYNVQFIVNKDAPKAALTAFLADPKPEALREMVELGYVDPTKTKTFLPSHLPLHAPDLRPQVGHHHHRTSVPGKPAGEPLIDLTGRARTVPAMETGNQWVVFGDQPSSRVQRVLGLGLEHSQAERIYQAKLKVHEVVQNHAPQWLRDRMRPPSPHYAPTPGNIVDGLYGGPDRPFANASVRYNLSLAGSSVLSHISQRWGGGWLPELRAGYNESAPDLAPIVDATRLDAARPPGWLETLVATGKTGQAVPVPKGGTAQLNRWLDRVDAQGDGLQQAWTARFREQFLAGDKPVIKDGTWLRQAEAQAIFKALG
ncbi:MAG TPA: hypothetical protein VHF86_04595, partial [Xanthomonadaceae bacterium]|nr:hypothetical protein [Xanthomonadaceae bacterium]